MVVNVCNSVAKLVISVRYYQSCVAANALIFAEVLSGCAKTLCNTNRSGCFDVQRSWQCFPTVITLICSVAKTLRRIWIFEGETCAIFFSCPMFH